MEATSLFDAQMRRAQATATNNGKPLVSGSEAFAIDNKPRRRSLDNSVFHDGDTVVVPFLPTDTAHPEDKDKWLALPINRGGDPVLRAHCLVTDKDGKQSVKELFAGTLCKFVRDRETQAEVATTGTAVDAIADCETNTEIWQKLAGKTLKFHSPKTVKTIIRGFNGRPDREGNQTVWTIDLA